MAVAALKFISEEEYLVLEEASEAKHEYYAGQIYAMAGGSPDHALISSNIIRELSILAGEGPCKVFTSDLRIRVNATGLNTYPDASVVCGELSLTERRPKGCTNPSVIVEVLSESTHFYDRRVKWSHYQKVPALSDYVLIWQDEALIEHYTRQDDRVWIYRAIEGLEATLELSGLGGSIKLSAIFRGITLPKSTRLRANYSDTPGEETMNGNS